MTGQDADTEKVEQIVVGWSPDGDETRFVLSPTRFCQFHRLCACQSGIVRFLSRYQFEKNPWLVDQSRLLLILLVESGVSQNHTTWSRLKTKIGFQRYLAPRIGSEFDFSVSNYCLVNGISPKIALPIGLVCNSPTREHLVRAQALVASLKNSR